MATLKQAQYIADYIRKNNSEYPTLETIWKKFAPDGSLYNFEALKKLEKELERLSVSEASYIISWMMGKKDKYGRNYSTKYAFQYLVKLNLVK